MARTYWKEPIGKNLLNEIKKQKATTTKSKNGSVYKKASKEHFTKQDRNSAAISALKDGYTQAKIAKFIGVYRSLVDKIIKDN